MVKATPGTESLLQKAYPSKGKASKPNTCGTVNDLCCNPKACDCFPGMPCSGPQMMQHDAVFQRWTMNTDVTLSVQVTVECKWRTAPSSQCLSCNLVTR